MSETTEVMSLKEKLLADFSIRKTALLLENQVLRGFREKSAEAFAKLGFPGKKHEEYRYINFTSILSPEYSYSFSPSTSEIPSNVLENSLVLNDAFRVVLVNGHFSENASQLTGLTNGVVVESLASAIRRNDVHALSHLGTLANNEADAFIALNSALFVDGLFVYLPKGVQLEKPLQIIQVSTGDAQQITMPRILLVAESDTNAQIVHTQLSLASTSASFSNTVAEVLVEQNAFVQWTTLQAEENSASHVNTLEAHVKKGGNFSTVTISLGGQTLRNNLQIALDEAACEAHLYGYYHPTAGQTFDQHTLVDHRFPKCESNELYKGVIDADGTAVFNGKVYVRKDAQKTNAYQSNKNILLSEQATVNTKPQLEIYADDVKCSHGSSTGVLDPEQLFYLRSRGISVEKARALLLSAYAGEVLEKIPHEALREALADALAERI